jgi:hypothetical protein
MTEKSASMRHGRGVAARSPAIVTTILIPSDKRLTEILYALTDWSQSRFSEADTSTSREQKTTKRFVRRHQWIAADWWPAIGGWRNLDRIGKSELTHRIEQQRI